MPVLFHGVPKWSTLKNNLGVKVNEFSKMESHLNVRTFIYFELNQLKRYLLLFNTAILKGFNNPLAILRAGSIATGYPSRLDYFSDRHKKALFHRLSALNMKSPHKAFGPIRHVIISSIMV